MTKSTTTRNTHNRSNIPEDLQYILDIQDHGEKVSLLFIVGDMKSSSVIELNLSKQLNLIMRILPICNSKKREFLTL